MKGFQIQAEVAIKSVGLQYHHSPRRYEENDGVQHPHLRPGEPLRCGQSGLHGIEKVAKQSRNRLDRDPKPG